MSSKPSKFTREATLKQIRADGKDVLLSFSCGKDSLSAWIILRDYGFTVHPFYMYLVPNLGFVEHTLKHYEKHFGVHIPRVAHPNGYWWIRSKGFQPPEVWDAVDSLGLPRFDYPDVNAGIARKLGFEPERMWTAVGTRVVDSPIRRWQLTVNGPINHTKRIFMPIFDMRKDEQIELLRKAKVKLANDYQIFARSFDGIDYRFLKPIKDNYPEDYAKILARFPLAHLEFVRAKLGEKHGQGKYV